MIYTKQRAKRTEILNLLLELGLEWRVAPAGERLSGLVWPPESFGYIYERGGTRQLSGYCHIPDDDRDALCDKAHRSLRWWGDYLQAIVYRLKFGELPKDHNLDFGISDEGIPE